MEKKRLKSTAQLPEGSARMTTEEIIDVVEKEYEHAWNILLNSNSLTTRRLAAGHAQCASAILDRVRPNPNRNQKMAELMKAILSGS